MGWSVSSTPTQVAFGSSDSVGGALDIDDLYFSVLTNTTGGFTATLAFVSIDGLIITCEDLIDGTTVAQLSIISKKCQIVKYV